MSNPSSASGSLLAVCTLPPWPADNGYSLRVSNLLSELGRRWSITLISPPLEKIPDAIARHVPVTLTGRGFTYPWRFDQTVLREAVERTVADIRPDRALVWPGAESIWFGRTDLPEAVADSIDCNPLEFWRGMMSYRDIRQRYYSLREIPVSALFARRMVRAFAATTCVGEADARWLRKLGGCGQVHVMPNGVAIPPEDALTGEAARPTVGFQGTLDYQPNIEAVVFAVDAVWPRIRAKMPEARFVIAGRNPGPKIRALTERPGIEIAADVPDMTAIIGQSWVSLAPMRSGVGIKNKVLEAWACARPVVMTRIATNGLLVPPDHRKLVCDDAEGLARTTLGLLADTEARRQLGASARENVLRHFTWQGIGARMDRILRGERVDG